MLIRELEKENYLEEVIFLKLYVIEEIFNNYCSLIL